MKGFSLLFFLLLLPELHFGQEIQGVVVALEEKIEKTAGDDLNAEDAVTSDLLETLVKHPLNLHSATEEQLRSTGLFSERQLQALTEHKLRFGKMIAVEELQLVEGFSLHFIRTVLPYLTCKVSELSGKSAAEVFTEGDHYLLYRVYRVLEQKAGYADGPFSAYKGTPFGSLIRYRYSYKNTIAVSINAEKDPGEEFFTGSNKNGFDFYSASVSLMGLGRLRMLVLGDFQVAYGQGLTFASSSGGFSGDPVFMKRNNPGIRPYKSATESGFQRGVATSVQLSRSLIADVFLSSVALDGNLRSAEDSLYEENSVSSFQSSGFHRTWSEISDRRALNEKIAGTHLAWNTRVSGVGFTAVQVSFSKLFEKTLQPYNRFDFSGMKFVRYGIDFWRLLGNTVLYGEVTRVADDSWAGVGGVMISADKNLIFSLSARSYPRDFMALHASAPGQRSVNSNESGLSSALSLNFSRYLQMTAGYDVFRYPWMIYGTDAPFSGSELNLRLAWTPAKKHELYMRFRRTVGIVSQFMEGRPLDALAIKVRTGLRFHAGYQLTESVTGRTRLEFVTEDIPYRKLSGIMFCQDITLRPLNSRWQFSARYALFETDGYEARIYAYENDVPGSYSVPSYYYKGIRYYLLVRFKASSALSFWVKYGAFVYDNRTIVGSGYEAIEGNRKSEIKFQVKYDFE